MFTPDQCRAARGLLDWSQGDLAEKAHVGIVTVRQLEAGSHSPRRSRCNSARFEFATAEFIDENGGGAGVLLRKRQHEKT
jgi:predicted transcriptional regulator